MSGDWNIICTKEIERRRAELRLKARAMRSNEEATELLADKVAEGEAEVGSSEEESEYEEYTDSEEEDGPMLKPVSRTSTSIWWCYT